MCVCVCVRAVHACVPGQREEGTNLKRAKFGVRREKKKFSSYQVFSGSSFFHEQGNETSAAGDGLHTQSESDRYRRASLNRYFSLCLLKIHTGRGSASALGTVSTFCRQPRLFAPSFFFFSFFQNPYLTQNPNMTLHHGGVEGCCRYVMPATNLLKNPPRDHLFQSC